MTNQNPFFKNNILPRNILLQLRHFSLVLLVVFQVSMAASHLAEAATITVTSTADNTTEDAQITLREAIIAANTDTKADSSIPGSTGTGSGADTIVLPSGTITILSALPEVTTNIVFDGPGASQAVITKSDDVTVRIFSVTGNPNVAFEGITINGGNSGAGNGGGISNLSTGIVTIQDCVISNNIAINGAGIFNGGEGKLIVSGCAIKGNFANSSNGKGGAIMDAGNGTIDLQNSTLSGNQALLGGALFVSDKTALTVLNCTISGNRADPGSTSAGGGGAVADSSSGAARELSFSNSTIVLNTALNSFAGGGFTLATTTATIQNSIIARNTNNTSAPSGSNFFNFGEGAITSLGNNLHDEPGSSQFNTQSDIAVDDPQLTALQHNGGPSHLQTHLPLPGSKAIDRGNNSSVVSSKDQRGATRVLDGDNNESTVVDIGAVETDYRLAITAGQTQSQTLALAFPTKLTVSFTEFNVGQSDFDVIFTAPSSGASGDFTSFESGEKTDTQTTDESGSATAIDLFANSVAGTYAVTVIVKDSAGGIFRQQDFSLTNLNQRPAGVSASSSVDEDGELPITLNATDADTIHNIFIYTVTDPPQHGTLNITSGSGSALDIVYTPNPDFNGNDFFQFTAEDEGGRVSSAATVDITVNPINDQPQVDVPIEDIVVEEDSEDLLVDLTTAFKDIETPKANLSYTITTLTGSPEMLSAPVGDIPIVVPDGQLNLSFVPDANGTVAFVVTATDRGDPDESNDNPDQKSQVIAFSVTATPVNDAPTVSTLPGTQTINEDTETPLVFSVENGNSIGVSDIDSGESIVRATLSVGEGEGTLQSGEAGPLSTIVLSDTLSNINAALNGLTYRPAANFNGTATLTILIDDLGNTGSGGSLTDSAQVSIEVISKPDLKLAIAGDTTAGTTVLEPPSPQATNATGTTSQSGYAAKQYDNIQDGDNRITITVATDAVDGAAGARLTLKNISASGTFTGFSAPVLRPTTTATLTITDDTTLTFNWKRQYLLAFIGVGSGSGTITSKGVGFYDENTTVDITANSADGFVFDKWQVKTGAGSFENLGNRSNTISLTMNDRKEVKAFFIEDSDNDGLPNTIDPNPNVAGDQLLDTDKDGFDNLNEFWAGTDLNDAASFPALNVKTVTGILEGNVVKVSAVTIGFTGPTNSFILEFNPGLVEADWEAIATINAPALEDFIHNSSNAFVPLPSTLGTGFYRIRLISRD